MKFRVLISAPCLAVLVLASCSRPTKQASRTEAGGRVSTAPSGAEAARRKEALVRFANADSGSAGDLHFDSAPMFLGVRYREVSAYAEWPAARGELKLVNPANNGTELVRTKETFDQGGHYTVVAFPDPTGKPAVKAFKDDLSKPAPGKVRVRIINAAEGVKDVEIFVAGTKKSVFHEVASGSATSYQEISPALTALDVRNKQTGRIALRMATALHPGGIYTFLLTANAAKEMESVQIQDQLGGPPATGRGPQPDSGVTSARLKLPTP